MKELYVIVRCGYEGIEKLVYPTLSQDDAVNKIKELRKNITDAIEHKNKVLEEFGTGIDENLDTIWDKMLFDKKITYEEYENSNHINPDSYCIRKWSGNEFYCACKELDVEPSEPWLMG